MAVSKQALVPQLPKSGDKQSANNFCVLLDSKLQDITDDNNIQTYRELLLYKPDLPDGSHVDLHMPNKSNGKLMAQNSALDTLLKRKKQINSCFADKLNGYHAITNAIAYRVEEIVGWLQSDNDHPYPIVLTKDELDEFSMMKESNDSLGYGYQKTDDGRVTAFEAATITVVLRKNETSRAEPLGFNGLGFHVFTAYPGQKLYPGDDMKGIVPLQEAALPTMVKTDYYKHATNMEKAYLCMMSTDKVKFRPEIKTYYDSNCDKIVICSKPDYDQTHEKVRQKRFFISQNHNDANKTNIRVSQYQKQMYDSEAKFTIDRDFDQSTNYQIIYGHATVEYYQKYIEHRLQKSSSNKAPPTSSLTNRIAEINKIIPDEPNGDDKDSPDK